MFSAPTSSRPRARTASAFALAVAVALLVLACTAEPPDPSEQLPRWMEARVDGMIYRECTLAPRDFGLQADCAATLDDPRVVQAMAYLHTADTSASETTPRTVMRGPESPGGSLHRLATALSLETKKVSVTRYLRELRARAEAAPDDPQIANLHAAALLHRYALGGQADDVVWGFEEADRALRLDPSSASAAFNRAIALERIHLTDAAIDAWNHFIELESVDDPSSRWIDEAHQRLERLAEAPSVRNPVLPEDSIDRYLQRAEAGVAAWVAAHDAGDLTAAAEALDEIETVGDLLAERGDDLWRDTATWLRAQTKAGSAPSPEVVEAHRLWVEARRLVDARSSQAADSTDQAFAQLKALSSPLALNSLVDRLICSFRDKNRSAIVDLANQILQKTSALGYQIKQAEVHYAQGLDQLELGQYSGANASLLKALSNYRTTDHSSEEAATLAALAFVDDQIGTNGPKRRLDAIRESVISGSKHRIPAIFIGIARSFGEANFNWVALTILNQTIDTDLNSGSPVALSEALWLRGDILRRLGNKSRAIDELQEAQEATKRISSRADARLIEAGISIDLAETYSGIDPRQCIRAAQHARRLYRQLGGFELQSLRIESTDALCNLALQDKRTAESRLENALSILADQSARAKWEDAVRLRDRMRHLTEELARMRYFDLNDPTSALLALELNTATTLHRRRKIHAFTLDRTASPVVRLALLGNQLVWWVIKFGRISHTGVLSLDKCTSSLRGPFEANSRSEAYKCRIVQNKAQDLIQEAIVSDYSRLPIVAVVLDQALFKLDIAPPSRLKNSEPPYLAVQVPSVMLAPSESFLEPLYGEEDRVLVVGIGLTNEELALEPLPRAANDAVGFARSFSKTVSILEATATKAAVLKELPDADVFYFAGHSIQSTRGQPGLVLADGILTAQEIRDLNIAPRVVILASCESALGPTSPSEGGPLSLLHAFIEAGTEIAVGSMEPVLDSNHTPDSFLSYPWRIVAAED